MLLLFLAGASLSHSAWACPPGYYSIGGQGVRGCAPIPAGDNNGNSGNFISSVKIVPQWGAIARSVSGDAIGWAIHEHKQESANRKALKACKQKSDQNCEIVASYSGQCGVALLHYNSGQFGVFTRDLDAPGTPQQAIQEACPQGCRTSFFHCTRPYNRNGRFPEPSIGAAP
ncbi:DUF4189 domain-containing protein [Stenotrophomonas sp. ATs4]|uniref:DUF4189 domain-containing protein n=1 Tax=Stenotrophomonas sp. ATs4 TaxID=3402766 RepID=UPI003F722186